MAAMAILIIALSFITGCAGENEGQSETEQTVNVQTDAHSEPAVKEKEETQPQKEPEPEEVTMIAVGDNLLHNTVIKAAKTGDGYDFKPMYENVRELIESADIAFVNQEAPLAGNIAEVSGYPNFNSPQEAGRDLVEIGFDVINQANNHSMDKGKKAVMATVDFWKNRDDSVMLGMYGDEDDRSTFRIVEKNGIKIGFLSYTYGTNGIPIPKDTPYLIPLIDKDVIKADIEGIEDKCDALAVSMHWGVEYQLKQNGTQEELAEFLCSLGVDLIIGHHPHVIQPAAWIESENGNRAFCVYSLGNFISSQEKTNTMLGGMMSLTLRKYPDGRIEITDEGVIPLVTHYENGGKNYRVYPLWDYTDDLAKRHRVNAKDKKVTVEYFEKLSEDILGEFWIKAK